MMIPGVLAQRRAAGVAPTLWTPLNMTTVPQIYLDAQDSVVTEVGGACSAISNLGSMGSAGDFSQATAASRPAIITAELNGNRVLRFDGQDDALECNTATIRNTLRGAGSANAFFVYKKRAVDGDNVVRQLINFSAGNSSAARFTVRAGHSTGSNRPAILARTADSGTVGILVPASPAGTGYLIMRAAVDYQTGRGEIFADGVSIALNADLVAAGITPGTTSQDPVRLGAAASSGFADIDLAAVVISSATVAAQESQKLEGWAAHKYGLTANLPANHPYKTAAPTV